MQNYMAYFHPGKNGKFDVTFPQFLGCVSQGDDFADAHRMAAEALALHVDGMLEDGEPLPASIEDMSPREIDKKFVQAQGDLSVPVMVVPIPLVPPSGKTVRIQVTMDSRLLSQIDAVTSNRSAFLADAAAVRLGSY